MGSGHNVVVQGSGQRSIMHPMDRERDRDRDRERDRERDKERMRRPSNASNAATTAPASNTNTLVGPGTGAAPSFLSLGSSFSFVFS